MSVARFDEAAPSRPLWLVTLADLALLLLGFFVFVQASRHLDGQSLANGFRAAFDAPRITRKSTPMPLELAVVDGFVAGDAWLPDSADQVIAWARAAARDPRTTITVTGFTDSSVVDVDPVTRSAAVLAADRARAVAAMLARSGAVAPGRIVIAAGREGSRRQVVLTLGYAGARR